MLRIVMRTAEAREELRRISNRTSGQDLGEQEAAVREILRTVKQDGDRALLDYTARLDGEVLGEASQLRVSGSELDAAYQKVSKEFIDAIRLACTQVEAFHRQRMPKSWVHFHGQEVVLGKRYTPLERAGIYVPGGRAAYPSTVVMNAIPARVAGVSRIVMVTPPGAGAELDPAVLVAAQEAGVEEIYRLSGAQAIAALAYGTETVPGVDVIVGSGDMDVTLAKKAVYGLVGIDSLAGASEVIEIADSGANPVHIAADLLAQAEHDPMAAAILLTPDARLGRHVQDEVERQLETHPRRILTEKAIAHYGLIAIVDSLAVAAELSNLFAPEHLVLAIAEPWELLESIRHAGAIFLGYSTPETVGDYLVGVNRTLPSSGAARYASVLGVETFMKHSSLVEYSYGALHRLSGALETIARAEGLHSHGESVRLRMEDRPS